LDESDGQSPNNLNVEDDTVIVVDGPSTDPIQVIDLDSYEFRVCTCPSFVSVTKPSPPRRVVLGLPAVSLLGRSRDRVLDPPAVIPLFPTLSTESDERRHYMACRYYRLRQRDLVARDLARVSPRRSPRLKQMLR